MRRGIALVLVLGILTLCSVLAVSFVHLQTVERRITWNHHERLRARCAADAGVERAIDLLGGGEWFGRTLSGRLDGPDCGYEVSILDLQGGINLNDGIDLGSDHAVSRNLSRVLDRLGDQVGVERLGERILARRPPGGFVHKRELEVFLREEFDRIREYVCVDSWRDPSVAMLVPLSDETGVLESYPILPDRPRHPDTGEVMYRRGHGLNRRGVSMHPRWRLSFIDPEEQETAWQTAWEAAVWTLRSLNPQWIETVGRSPVNVNAASREVLVALIVDLEGFFLAERRRPVPFDFGYAYLGHRTVYDPEESRRMIAWSRKGGELGFLHRTWPVDEALAGRIADRILEARSFADWEGFAGFLRGLVDEGVIRDPRPIFFDYVYETAASGSWRMGTTPSLNQERLAAEAMADVLLANFDPNLHLNELNPDRSVRGHVDKTDLLVQSTEFCFTSMGRFELRSVGRSFDAEHEVETVVRLFDAIRLSSQDELEGEFIRSRAGPEPEGSCGWGGFVSAKTRRCACAADVEIHFDEDWQPAGTNPDEPSGNVTARHASRPGPYGPSHRLVDVRVPGDLRIDGLYVELHGAYGVRMPPNPFDRRAAFSFWVKPSWSSDQTGKVRKFFSLSDTRWQTEVRVKNLAPRLLPLPFGLVFLPAWQGTRAPPVYGGEPRRASLMFAVGLDIRYGREGGGIGVVSPSLDGRGLEAGRWKHVFVSLDGGEVQMRLNGEVRPGTVRVEAHGVDPDGRLGDMAGASLRIGGEYSALGEILRVPRFDFADATIDEFHMWFDLPQPPEVRRFEEGAEYSTRRVRWEEAPRRLAEPSDLCVRPGNVPERVPELLAVAWTLRGGRGEAWVEAGDDFRQPVRNPGWSRAWGRFVRFGIRFETTFDTSPILDDVTFFFVTPGPRILSRVEVRQPTRGRPRR